ncbi:MAG: hypothetical protein ACI8QY_000698, partial [bacterium]
AEKKEPLIGSFFYTNHLKNKRIGIIYIHNTCNTFLFHGISPYLQEHDYP